MFGKQNSQKGHKKSLSACWCGILILTIIAVVSLIVLLFKSDAFEGGWGGGEESLEARSVLVALFAMVVASGVAIHGTIKEKKSSKLGDRAFAGAAAACACLTFVCFLLFGTFRVEGEFAEGEGASFFFGLANLLLAILYTIVVVIILKHEDADLEDSFVAVDG